MKEILLTIRDTFAMIAFAVVIVSIVMGLISWADGFVCVFLLFSIVIITEYLFNKQKKR